MGDHLFPPPPSDRVVDYGIVEGTSTHKQELVNLLRAVGGLQPFRSGQPQFTIQRQRPTHLPWADYVADSSTVIAERFHFLLCFVTLGKELWAYVECNGVIVVPPFEFLGWEYLPSQPW